MTGWQQAESNQDAYNQGWERIWGENPQFDPKEIEMMYEWVKKNQVGRLMLYLTEDRFRGLDEGKAQFVLNELLEDNL